MNLTLFFRLILTSIFQNSVVANKKNYTNEPMGYNNQYFYCPRVYAKDGFNVSLQIHNGSYCTSDKGYRDFSPTMIEVEFGFPSENEQLMHIHSEMWDFYNDGDMVEQTLAITNGEGVAGFTTEETERFVELYLTDMTKYNVIISKYASKEAEITTYIKDIIKARDTKRSEQFDVTGTVGNIPITVLEEVFTKHGGIDWEKTISVEQFNNLVEQK